MGREIFELKEEIRSLKDIVRSASSSSMGMGMGDYFGDDIEPIREEAIQPKEEIVHSKRTSPKKKALFKYIRNLVIAVILGGLSIFIGIKLTLEEGRDSHADIVSPYSHQYKIDTSLPSRKKEGDMIKEDQKRPSFI